MSDGQSKLFVHALITQCTELNPWLPIEQAPKDRYILLYEDDGGTKWVGYHDWSIDYTKPTHYQELPGDPE